MASSSEQGSGLGRGAVFLLVLVTLACIGLIGSVGYLKFQVDRSEYNLSNSFQAQPSVANLSAADIQAQEASVAKQRTTAAKDLRNWSFALTMVAWVSLMLVAALLVVLYLVLQRKQTPALRALGQSVSNLARGDMQTPIWGMERHDAVGELARSIDLARYHFSQLPDLSIMSDQGPVRLKFEGGARTLFEAMMQQLTTQAARVGDEAADLAKTAESQHKVLSELPVRLNTALDHMQRNDKANHQSIQRTTQNFAAASEQLEKLIPYMQSRAQGMAEVTQLAGGQVTTNLKAIVEAEQSIKTMASRSLGTLQDLSISTKDLGERVSAALAILQASGKMLNETTESTQGRVKEVVDSLALGGTKLTEVMDRVEKRLEATADAEASLSSLAEKTQESAGKIDGIIQSLADRHEKLGEQIGDATQRLDHVIESFDTAKDKMGEALQNITQDGSALGNVFQQLKTSNDQVLAKLADTSEKGRDIVQHLGEATERLIQQMQEKIVAQGEAVREQIDSMAERNATLSHQANDATQTLIDAANAISATPDKIESVHMRFEDVVNTLSDKMEKKTAESLGKTETLVQENFEKLGTLATSVDQALQRLEILSQLTGTLGTVAGQLGQIVPTLGVSHDEKEPTQAPLDTAALSASIADRLQEMLRDFTATVPAASAPLNPENVEEISNKLVSDLENKWKSSVEQIDSVRDDLSQLLEKQKDQLDMRLMLIDKQMKNITSSSSSADVGADQVALLQNIVSTLGTMNENLTRYENMLALSSLHSSAFTPSFGR